MARPTSSKADKSSKTTKAPKESGKDQTVKDRKIDVSSFEKALITRSESGDSNNLDVDDLFRVLDLYFYKDFYAYRHLQHSYNKFVDETIPDFLKNTEHVFTEVATDQRLIKHRFEFDNIRAETPKMANDIDPLFPADARKRILTYQMEVYADVTQYRDVIDINSTGKAKIKTTKIGHTEEGMSVMTVPTMVRSKYCNLNAHPDEVTDECRYDPGGYFITNGSEKVVLCQDKMIPDLPLVFSKKGSNTSFHVVQVNSVSDDLSNMMQTVSIKIRKDRVMVMKFPILYEVNPVIVFRALGIESDADIAEICAYDKTDHHMMELIRVSLDNCYNDNRENSRIKIRTQEEAIDYLITKMKTVRRITYTETNQAVKHEQKKIYLMELLKSSLLPHIKGNTDNPLREKALYMGYMIHKLMKVELGRATVDNRDSYCNKRVANINELLSEIMVQHYKSNMSECNKKFLDWMKDKSATEMPHNVIHHFKASVFEQGFKTALMQGNWPRAKGVSQMLSRISYMQLISYLSRIDSQSTSKSSSKLTKPRQLDASFVPFGCPVQTPEHAKIGLIKHLSMIGSITIGDKDNTEIVREYINTHDDIVNITDVPIYELKRMFKVFLNGEWVGMVRNKYAVGSDFSSNPVMRVYIGARSKKVQGEFNPQMTSIVLDIDKSEIRFNTDSGRLYRPVLRVSGDNELVLTKDMVKRISLNERDTGDANTWNKFYSMEEYPIEFIDSEEQPFVMIAPKIDDLNRERQKILDSKKLKFTGREDQVANRYSDNFFDRYDYCEIHPSILLGEIATNIPFANRNQGPRNIFQYAQGKQGMGIYCTTYRSRTDISYVLYHPETPIVNSRTSKYTYTDVLGPGCNAIVAIACYSGYNQEDSLIMNETSIQRGFMRSMSLKKYSSQITKNQETSANDKFMKPTPDKTLSMMNGQYDKLNLEGYVPEETVIVDRDIIFGKVTPITDMPDTDKIYKDASEQYKSHSPGVVDRVYTGIHNQEGHEVRKALVRMERKPMIGDKFCMTDDHDVLTLEGWVPIDKVTMNHHVASLVDGDTLKYQKPTALQEYDHDDDLYVIETNQISMRVTKNHRMYVAMRNTDNFKFENAEDIKGARRKYKKDVGSIDMSNHATPKCLELDGDGNVTHFVLHDRVEVKPTKKATAKKATVKKTDSDEKADVKKTTVNVTAKATAKKATTKKATAKATAKKSVKKSKQEVSDSSGDEADVIEYEDVVVERFAIDDWLEFFGIWIAEGCVTRNWDTKNIRISANKQRVKDALDRVCGTMGLKISKIMDKKDDSAPHSWRINNEHLSTYMDTLSTNATDKHLPNWVWHLNQAQSKMLLNGMMLGDGHAMKGTVTERYDTSSAQLRDDFQQLALHCGIASNYALKYAAGHATTVKTRNGKTLQTPETITSTVDAYRLSTVTKQSRPLVNKNANVARGTGYLDSYEHFTGKVYCCTVPGDGAMYIRRKGLTAWTGNSSRHGQKGTMGIGLRASDMPHTKDGIRPDVILNPNAIPSRMTIGQFWEQLMAKVGACLGLNMDGTSFEDYDIEVFKRILRENGYADSGKEYLYNGMTGQRIRTSIFITPAYYQRLKHLVLDKVHSRPRGSTTILVRQAAEGRSRDGGLRLGEMERDALIAHGMAKFLNEKMMYNSDVYSTYVCGMCGLFAVRETTRNSERTPGPEDTYKCPMCKNYQDIHKIMIPYAFKLMIQELMAMNILARIRVKKRATRLSKTVVKQ